MGGRLFYVFLIQILKGPSSGGVWRALADLEAVCVASFCKEDHLIGEKIGARR